MIKTLDKLSAILWRDLLTAIRHRSGFVITIVGVFTELAAFYFLSRAIGPSFRPGGEDYFPYLMVGTGLYTFFVMSAQAFLSSVQQAQQTGTLEVLMTTSTGPAELIVLSSISSFAGNLFHLLIFGLVGTTVFRAATHANWASSLIVLACCVAIALAIGIAAAAMQVAFQKGGALLWLLSSGLWFVSGTLFPITTLPPALQFFARSFPLSHAIDGMRKALLDGQPPTLLRMNLAILAGFSVTLLPLSLLGLSLALRRARRNGTLSFY